jgi:hypothetical protein
MADNSQQLAQAVRDACLAVAQAAYEDAGMSGLCEEGRWECAYQAIKQLDLDAVIRQVRDRGE